MLPNCRRAGLWIGLFLLVALLFPTTSHAQLLRGRRVALPPPEAIVGAPFGVGRISIQLPEARPGFFGEREFTLTEANGRVFYAAFDFQPVRAILREVLNRPQNVTAYFLFVGDEPLDLELFAPSPVRMRLSPRRDPGAHDRLLAGWWDEYTQATNRVFQSDEYPQLVDDYLVQMLANRLRLEPPDVKRSLFGRTASRSVARRVARHRVDAARRSTPDHVFASAAAVRD